MKQSQRSLSPFVVAFLLFNLLVTPQSGLQYIVSKEVESKIGPLPTSIYPDLYSPSVLVNIYSPFQFYKHMCVIPCRLSQTECKYTCLKQIIFAWLIFVKYIINA